MTTRENNEKEWQKQAIAEAFEDLMDELYFTHAIDFMDPNRLNFEYEEFLKCHS